jgi:hypothetical protein
MKIDSKFADQLIEVLHASADEAEFNGEWCAGDDELSPHYLRHQHKVEDAIKLLMPFTTGYKSRELCAVPDAGEESAELP